MLQNKLVRFQQVISNISVGIFHDFLMQPLLIYFFLLSVWNLQNDNVSVFIQE